MTRIHRLMLIAAFMLPGCARAPENAHDSATGAEHDPSIHGAHTGAAAELTDSAYAALQARGAMGMGVDQYSSTHAFEPRPDGGRITLRRNVDDSAGVEQIRAHLKTIADAFAAGNFETPGFVHAGTVPGTEVMGAKRAAISYHTAAIKDGGELIMATQDPTALDAIHRFLAFQRRAHRAGDGSDTARTPTRSPGR